MRSRSCPARRRPAAQHGAFQMMDQFLALMLDPFVRNGRGAASAMAKLPKLALSIA